MLTISNYLFCMENKIRELVLKNDLDNLQIYLDTTSKQHTLKLNPRKKKSFKRTLKAAANKNKKNQKNNLKRYDNRIADAFLGLTNLAVGFYCSTLHEYSERTLLRPEPLGWILMAGGGAGLMNAISNFNNKKAYDHAIEIERLLKSHKLIDNDEN